MANIKLTLPGEPFTKQIVTFTAPCDCASVTDGLVINGQTYTVCDAMGNCVTGKGGAWCAGAQISVVLDCEKKKAYVQNAAVPEMTIGNVSGLQSALDGKAASSHNHSASNITSGTLPVARGGTGATTAAAALSALGAAAASHNHAAGNITSGTLPVARGGTGVTANPSMLINLASTAAASVFAASPRPGVTGVLPVANGGTGVSSLAALATAMGAAKVEIGSYKGTGTYGSSNKNVLTFSFNPKVVIINDPAGHAPLVMVKGGSSTIRLFIASGNMCYSKEIYTFTDNVVNWYCNGVAGSGNPSMGAVGTEAQLNKDSWTYDYIGIG